METTKTFSYNLEAFLNPNIRLILNQGGTSSSKTFSEIQLLILYALKNKKKEIISIVAESIPHLKRGAIRDFQNILKSENIWNDNDYNRTDRIYALNNKTFEFFSAGAGDNLRGGRRDILFLNEANNIPFKSYLELEIRTKKKVFADWNPTHEFWVDSEGLRDLETTKFIKTTYKDNHLLDENIVKSIEAKRYTNPEWFKVYGLGEQGSLEGVIFKNWTQCKELPQNLSKVAGFIDFGYSNDPTTFSIAGLQDNEIYVRNFIYETGLTNKQIADRIKSIQYNKYNLSSLFIIADSAEPKSIQELNNEGLNVIGATKGKDSVNFGINLLKEYKINITSNSLNAIKELRNYQWKLNKLTGKYINTPEDNFNHFIDALRYYAIEKLQTSNYFFIGS